MSKIKVDRISNRAGTGAPEFVNGIKIVGITSVADIVGAAATFNSVSVGGTITYDDVTRIDSVGIVTAGGGLYVGRTEGTGTGIGATFTTAGDAILAGVVTATSFSGDGSGLSGVESWNQQDTWLFSP